MTILFNVTDAVGPSGTHGITRVERKLAGALMAHDDVEYVTMHEGNIWHVDRTSVAQRLSRQPTERVPVVERFGTDHAVGTGAGRRAQLRTAVRRIGAGAPAAGASLSQVHARPGDVLVSMGVDWQHGLLNAAERLVYGSDARFVGFCYDLIPIDHPEWLFPPDPNRFLRHFTRMTRIASSIVCISESTRLDLRRHFPTLDPARLPILVLGADAAVATEPHHRDFAESLFPGEQYAVYCATVDRRKNHQLLYRAMHQMARRGIPGNFVFVGKLGNGVSDLINVLRNDPAVAGRIAHVTNCDDAHLAAVYARSTFAVYPSLYEGWGLGVSEPLAHGRRSIIASGSSLEEAAFGTAVALPPLATTRWVDAIERWFADPLLALCDPPTMPSWETAAHELVRIVGT